MSKIELLLSLRKLEESLFDTEYRCDIAHLDKLLHTEFIEYGRSGRRYGKAKILQEAPLTNVSYSIEAKDFELAILGDGIALLTYTSLNMDVSGKPSRLTLRSSLWIQTSTGCQLRFHQGTPIDEATKDEG